MLNIIWAIIAGLVIGLLAKLIVPGRQAIPLWLTVLLGIVGGLGASLRTRLCRGRRRGYEGVFLTSSGGDPYTKMPREGLFDTNKLRGPYAESCPDQTWIHPVQRRPCPGGFRLYGRP